MRDLRIVFMGTPSFAVGVLKKLLEEGKNVIAVITAPDKPAGRGRTPRQSAIKEYALSQNLEVLQPTNLKGEEFLFKLNALKPNLQIVVAFRMLPKVVWSIPEFGTFNLHASLLPNYRGAAPINWAIMNREIKTGVTTFFIDEKIDTGEIIMCSEITIDKEETAGTLHDKLMNLGSQLVVDTVIAIEKGAVNRRPQPITNDVMEAPKLTSENTRINWDLSVEDIDATIRGLSPYPVAWTVLRNNGQELKVKLYGSTIEIIEQDVDPGCIIASKKQLKVAGRNGNICITEIQLPGKRKMAIVDLLNGFTISSDAKML